MVAQNVLLTFRTFWARMIKKILTKRHGGLHNCGTRNKVKGGLMTSFNLLGKRIEFSEDTMNFAECYGTYLIMQNVAGQLL